MEKNPDNPELNLGMGQILMSDNQNREAATFLEKAIAGGDQPDYIYTDLADLYSREGRPEKAIAVYTAAVEKARTQLNETEDPSIKDLSEDILDRALMNLAREHRKNENLQEAEKVIGEILQRKPQHQEALHQLKRIKKLKG